LENTKNIWCRPFDEFHHRNAYNWNRVGMRVEVFMSLLEIKGIEGRTILGKLVQIERFGKNLLRVPIQVKFMISSTGDLKTKKGVSN